MPQESDEWLRVASEFENKWQYPHCIGALDGKHVAIIPPPNSGSLYYNYKHFNSIVLLASAEKVRCLGNMNVPLNCEIADSICYFCRTLEIYVPLLSFVIFNSALFILFRVLAQLWRLLIVLVYIYGVLTQCLPLLIVLFLYMHARMCK